MRPAPVVIVDILGHQPLQVAFVQNDDMIEQVPPATANPPLGYTVLPLAPEAGPLGLNSEALHRADAFFIELGRGKAKIFYFYGYTPYLL
jgi:hypothetical protein